MDDDTVVASNLSKRTDVAASALPREATLTVPPSHAIADTGATSHFVMAGTPMDNIRPAVDPLTINLPNGGVVRSTHVCDVVIPGLPTVMTGHIVPGLSMASLMGIRVLCKAGCVVIFTNAKCEVWFNKKLILQGTKDPSTDLWTLPITPAAIHKPGSPLGKDLVDQKNPTPVAVAAFAHSLRTRANAVKYAHQSLGNPKISTLLKAIKRDFLKGCPNLSVNLVTKYLNASPATAKGHMKRPKKGIRSTTPKVKPTEPLAVPVLPLFDRPPPYNGPAYGATAGPNVIDDTSSADETIANVFCFGAFADKVSGVVYNDLTGNFPFMSLDGSVCFFVLYHYETNAILATPIAGLDDKSIFEAYKTQFEMLEAKGYKPKVNVMDNQATKYIKQFLTKKECKLQLVEPHNHRVNAAERAIQTFKDAFIATLATTDSEFPLQLWDKLTPQVQDTLNLLRASRVNPAISAYEALNGPYDWGRYPLAPPGCKAIIYESPAVRGSWATRGTDAWLLGPSKDHYRCNLFYVPETRAYRISGSAELFPQHCQLPNLGPIEHLDALTTELATETIKAATTPRGKALLQKLRTHLDDLLSPPATVPEQRVTAAPPAEVSPATIQRVTDSPPIMHARNPTAKRSLLTTKRVHLRHTRNNTPGGTPTIVRNTPDVIPVDNSPATPRRSPRTTAPASSNPLVTFSPMPGRRMPYARARLISQQALNALTVREALFKKPAFTPQRLTLPEFVDMRPNFAHYASPMIHPLTGEVISSYKRLMNDPATAEIWQTAFGKDFGGMAQGDDKTGQKGTDSMFVMKHDEIKQAYLDKQRFTYAKVVVDHRPQKEDANRIRITAGGNLIKFAGDVSTRTADLCTSKLLWNSVLSTPDAKYMCLDIKNFYLTAALDYFEYMRMPLELFPSWIRKQYDLDNCAYNGFVHLRLERAVWGLPQAGILANKLLRKRLAPHGYYECANTPGLWRHEWRPITFTLVVDDFGVKYVGKEHADHLVKCIGEKYKLVEDWTGDLYCGIKLGWDYNARTLDISMPGYVTKQLHKYKHVMSPRPQHCPYSPEPKKYGSEAQSPLPVDTSRRLDDKEIKSVQKIVGSILYYARAVDMTVLMSLSTIASEQTKGTERTMEKALQVLDYLATHPDAKVRFRASDMILNIHSDASYLTEPKSRSRASGHFFLGWLPVDGKPIRLNGAFHTLCSILRFVVSSAAEAELGALFLNCQEGLIFRLTLEDLGHPQPKTPVHCDNATAIGIANNTIKRQRSRAMEMRYFWVADKVAQDRYKLVWHPGQENLADYQSKHHPGAHHAAVRPYYLHEENSPLVLPRAIKPSTLKGCVGTLQDGYVRNVPLPRVPREQRASHEPTAPKGIQLPGYLSLPAWIPTLPRIGNALGFSQRIL